MDEGKGSDGISVSLGVEDDMDKVFIHWDDSNMVCRKRGSRIAAVSLALALALAVSSIQAQTDLASEAYKPGDSTALREWRSLADQGDAAAQHIIGTLYEAGMAYPRTIAKPRSGTVRPQNRVSSEPSTPWACCTPEAGGCLGTTARPQPGSRRLRSREMPKPRAS